MEHNLTAPDDQDDSSQERVFDAVAALQIAMFKADLSGRYTSANRRWLDLAGLSAAAALGDGWHGAVHPDDKARVTDEWRAYLAQGQPAASTYRFLGPDGTPRWVTARHTLLHGSDGQATGHIGVVIDVNEEREQALVVETQRAQLLAAARLAALGEMAGGIAHEINTPLSTIGINVAVLKDQLGTDTPRPARTTNALDTIERTLTRIADVIRGLRTYARDGVNDQPHPVVLTTILEDTLAICRQRLRSHGIALQVDNTAPGIVLNCVPVQISQVLLNLLNNAYDAVLPLVDKWIHVGIQQLDHTCTIRVMDSGQGIPAGVRERIMDAFFTTKQHGQGSGLGLSISRSIITAHGGTLSLDPAAAHTTFVISLPLTAAVPPVPR